MFEVAVAWEDVKLWVAWSCFETSPALQVVGLAALWVHIRIRFSDWKTRPSCRWTRSDWWTGPKRFPGYRKWGGGDVLLMPGDGFFSKNYFPWISFLIDEEISVNVLIFLVLDVIYLRVSGLFNRVLWNPEWIWRRQVQESNNLRRSFVFFTYVLVSVRWQTYFFHFIVAPNL